MSRRDREYTDRVVAALTQMHIRDMEAIGRQLDERASAVNERLGEAARVLELRFNQADERLERMNEIRDAMRDQAQHFVTMEVFSQRITIVDDRLAKIEGQQERQRGRMAAYAVITSVTIVVLAIVTLVLDHVRL